MARRSRHRLLLLLLRYLVVALGYHKAYGSSAPKGHQVVTAIEYQEVILACKYAKKSMSSRLEWKKLGRSVSFVYYQQSLQGDFKYRAEMIDFSIRIKNVTRNDAGKYRCEISAPSKKGQNLEEDTVTLEVLVAPAVPLCNVPSSALSGTVVELRCHDKEGNPAPEYTWFKDGVNLLENPRRGPQSSNSSYTMNTKSGTLQFNTVSKLDSGEYFCEAHNSVGRRRCHAKRMQVDDLNIRGIIAAVVGVAFVISVCGLGVCYAQRKGYFSKETSFQRSNSASKATTMSENTKQIPGFTGPTNGTWIPHRVTGKMSVVRLCLAPHSSVALDASHQTPCNISYKGPDSGYFKPYWFYGACYNYSTPPW